MRNMILAVVFLFGVAMNVNAQERKGAPVQNADSSWERVSTIKAQQKIKVLLQNGGGLEGRFLEADQEGIVLQTKTDKHKKIGREEILRISRRSAWKSGLIGLGIGFGGGAALGAAKPPVHDAGASRAGNALLVGGVGGLIGLGIGAAVGTEQTIYRHPAAPTKAPK